MEEGEYAESTPMFGIVEENDPRALLLYSAREDRFVHIERMSSAILEVKSRKGTLGIMTSDGVLKIIRTRDFRTIHSLSVYQG